MAVSDCRELLFSNSQPGGFVPHFCFGSCFYRKLVTSWVSLTQLFLCFLGVIMLAEKQATSHSRKCELKTRSRTTDYEMNRGLSIKLAHITVGWLLLVQHFLKCSSSPIEWCQELKLQTFHCGFKKQFLFCSVSYVRSIFFPTLVRGNNMKTGKLDVCRDVLQCTHLLLRFWSSTKPRAIRG